MGNDAGNHSKYYPMMADLSGALCVVVGGGSVAWRKIAGLLECGARVVVVSPEGVPALEAAASEGRLVWHRRPYRPGDLAGARLAFAAANEPEVNADVGEEARREGVWLNAAHDARQGDFIHPAVVRRDRLVIAVTTGGASPRLARRIADRLEQTYGPEYAEYVAMLARLRELVMASGAPAERKLRCLGELLEGDALERLRRGEPARDVEEACKRKLATALAST